MNFDHYLFPNLAAPNDFPVYFFSVTAVETHFARRAKSTYRVARMRFYMLQNPIRKFPVLPLSGYVQLIPYVQQHWNITTDFAIPCLRAKNVQIDV